jgi:hypothetical protein
MKHLIGLALLLSPVALLAQDQQQEDIDPSKPTNLYTQVNAQGEYKDVTSGGDLMGARINIQFAPNSDNLVLAELPILHNDSTGKTGISDVRVRYFTVVKRNISERLIAVAPFVDVTAPTGSTRDGLGQGVWSIAGGAVIGYVVSPKFSLFPGLGYVHIAADKGPNSSSNGIALQMNASYAFSPRTFMFINPTPAFLNTNGTWADPVWKGDVSLTRILVPNRFTMNVGFAPNFTQHTYTYSTGFTFFI